MGTSYAVSSVLYSFFKVESFKLPSSCDCVTGPSYWTKDGDVADLSDLYHHPKHLLSYQGRYSIAQWKNSIEFC